MCIFVYIYIYIYIYTYVFICMYYIYVKYTRKYWVQILKQFHEKELLTIKENLRG